jgi:predicted LPLAT superfamily acyltransferase
VTSQSWTIGRERGSAFAIRLMIWLTEAFGSPLGRALLYPITLYFLLTCRTARRASRRYLARVLSSRPSTRDVFRHFFCFASVLYERWLIACGREDEFELTLKGIGHLRALVAAKRGALLLGAHFGNFDVLRLIAERECPVPVRVLMYPVELGPFSAALRQRNPQFLRNVIEIGTPASMLAARDAITHGEFVAMLADRSPDERRMLKVPFLGGLAAFPIGPMKLAAMLDAPVLLCFAIRTEPGCYEVRFEPFADRLALCPTSRATDLEERVAHFAQSLEAVCRAYPLNWFNFHDIWDDGPGAPIAPARADRQTCGRPDAALAGRGLGSGELVSR